MSKSGKPAISRERNLALLKQSLANGTSDDIADAMWEYVDLETVFDIVDRVLSRHQKRMEEIIASEKGGDE